METGIIVNAMRIAAATPEEAKDALTGGLTHGVPLIFVDGSPPPAHLSTTVHAGWSDKFFFLKFDATFTSLRTAPASIPTDARDGRTPSLWEQSDVLECYIGYDARNTQRYGEFQVAPDGRWTSIGVQHRGEAVDADYFWDSGLKHLSIVDNARSIWTVVMQIPWSTLETFGEPGGDLHGNFFRATGRYHGDELLAWSPTGTGRGCFHRPQFFGAIQLV